MTTELRERLAELAGGAPTSRLVPADLWTRGTRRRRRQRVAYGVGAAAGALAVIAGVSLGPSVLGTERHEAPAAPERSELHLPERVLAPDPWSDGTADAGEIGPLAAIGDAERLEPRGWNDELGGLEVFGVSAVDGTVRFLDFGLDESSGYVVPSGGAGIALSPNGRTVAFELWRRVGDPGRGRQVQVGWGLYDTVTGELSVLQDPQVPAWNGTGLVDLVFTADSRHLVTSYPLEGNQAKSRNHGLVLWDVATQERIVVEQPGHYWFPNTGPAPRGLLIGRKFDVRHVDPEAGDLERFRLDRAVVTASLGPDGKAFAYIGGSWTPGPDGGINGRTWRLYVGPDRGALQRVDLPEADLGVILGWSDRTHVVINGWGDDYTEVDVTGGDVRTFRIPGSSGGPARLATDYLGNDLVPAVQPEDAGDPRTAWKIGLAAAGVTGLLAFALWAGRRRGRA